MTESVQSINVGHIDVGHRLRAHVGDDYVRELAESIRDAGLVNPITVVEHDGRYRLVAGLHRLEACRSLGWSAVPAIVRDIGEVEAELAEIDENLIRRELTILEQAEHLARRDDLLKARGDRAPSHRPEKGASAAPLQTTGAIAGQVGMSERTAQERMQVARGLTEETRDILRGKAAANERSILLQLARVRDPAEQEEVARRLASRPTKWVNDVLGAVRQDRRRRAGRCEDCDRASDELVDGLCPECATTRRRQEAAARGRATRGANETARGQCRTIIQRMEEWMSREPPSLAGVLEAGAARSDLATIRDFRAWLGRLERELEAVATSAPTRATTP